MLYGVRFGEDLEEIWKEGVMVFPMYQLGICPEEINPQGVSASMGTKDSESYIGEH